VRILQDRPPPAAVAAIPGLLALIAFSTINNFLGGLFMALLDAYGLSLVSVQAWGLLFGAASAGFILGGLAIARFGLGANPLRTQLLVTSPCGPSRASSRSARRSCCSPSGCSST
jgi:DHA3 family multidrug efflux protein-like MFS transporter